MHFKTEIGKKGHKEVDRGERDLMKQKLFGYSNKLFWLESNMDLTGELSYWPVGCSYESSPKEYTVILIKFVLKSV